MAFNEGDKVKVTNIPQRLSVPFFMKYNGRTGTVVRFAKPFTVVSFGPSQADDMAFYDEELSLVTDVPEV